MSRSKGNKNGSVTFSSPRGPRSGQVESRRPYLCLWRDHPCPSTIAHAPKDTSNSKAQLSSTSSSTKETCPESHFTFAKYSFPCLDLYKRRQDATNAKEHHQRWQGRLEGVWRCGMRRKGGSQTDSSRTSTAQQSKAAHSTGIHQWQLDWSSRRLYVQGLQQSHPG